MRDSDGRRIVELPEKEVQCLFLPCSLLTFFQVTVETLEFSPLERKIYDAIYADAKRDFDQLNANGLVSRNYTHILAMLMRYSSKHVQTLNSYLIWPFSLRRAVLHPSLVIAPDDASRCPSDSRDGLVDVDEFAKQFSKSGAEGGDTNSFVATVLGSLGANDAQECPICFDVMQSPMIIPRCLHQW
jgi:DNA repair protein RAD5